MVRSWYYEKYPLLAAAWSIVVEFNGSESIHEASDGGLNTREVAHAALVFTGMPPRCQADVEFAEAWLSRLQDEMARQSPPPVPDLADAVIGAEFPLAGSVIRPEEFADLSAEQRAEHVELVADEILASTSDKGLRALFTQALALALPAVYEQISTNDEAHRRRRGMGLVAEGGEA